jgi:hypothetical protein
MRSFRTAPGSWVILCCNTRLQFTQKSSNRIILGRKIAMIQENFMIELFYKATKSPSFFLPPWYPQTFLIKLLTKQPSHQAPPSSSSFTSYQLAEFISPRPSCISTPMRNLQAHCTTNVAHPQNHSSCSKPTCTHSLHIPSKTTFTDTAIYRRALFVLGARDTTFGNEHHHSLCFGYLIIYMDKRSICKPWDSVSTYREEQNFTHTEDQNFTHIILRSRTSGESLNLTSK